MNRILKCLRRGMIAVFISALTVALASAFTYATSAPEQLRIGYQKYSTPIVRKLEKEGLF